MNQGSDMECEQLSAPILMEKRRRYNTLMGDNPTPQKQVSDKQLSALSIVVGVGVCPFIDMGVWQPYGTRVERAQKFKNYIPDGNGGQRMCEMPGAPDLETWLKCWAVFRTAGIMDNLADSATLDRYADQFEKNCLSYPGCWHICASADIVCRTEHWPELRRRRGSFPRYLPYVVYLRPCSTLELGHQRLDWSDGV